MTGIHFFLFNIIILDFARGQYKDSVCTPLLRPYCRVFRNVCLLEYGGNELFS